MGMGYRVFRDEERITIDLTQSKGRIDFRLASSSTFGCYLVLFTIYIARSLGLSREMVGLIGPNNNLTDDCMTQTGNIIPLPEAMKSQLFAEGYITEL